MLHFLLSLLYANVRTIASHFSTSQIPAITYSAHGRAMELPRARYRVLSSVRFLLHTPSLFRNHLQIKKQPAYCQPLHPAFPGLSRIYLILPPFPTGPDTTSPLRDFIIQKAPPKKRFPYLSLWFHSTDKNQHHSDKC